MTMLDRMRRHRNWLKWSLALVCLAFVVFYIPDFLSNPTTDLAATNTVAVVEGHEIRGEEFRRTYQAQLQAYRSAYGGNMSEALLKQLGVDQQILQQMVDERAALAEAERLKIRVSDAEVRLRILAIPAFQENGAFIGAERYRQLLASQNPPMNTTEFEDGIRRALIVEKLRASVTEWLSVSDKEIEQEYRRRNDKVKLAVASILSDSLRGTVSASDAEVSTYFEAHTSDFKIPEKRKIRHLLVDTDAMRAKMAVPPADVERAYNDNFELYSTPEQIRASHILLKTSRQGRGRRPGAGRRPPEASQRPGPTSPSSPRRTRKTKARQQRAAIWITSDAAGWSPNSTKRPSRCSSPDRSATWSRRSMGFTSSSSWRGSRERPAPSTRCASS